MRMPYVVGPPVKLPTDFFGRARQTEQFFELLGGAQAQCISILGLRRAGKTSFLQYVSHPEVMAAYLPDPRQYVMIAVDVSACRTAADFYGRVYRKLIAGLSRRAGVQLSPPSDATPPADAYAVESLLYEYAGRRVVLLLDEFDQLRTADFGGEFMTELRALAGVWEYELAYVTASYWDLPRLGNFVGLPPTSPFYNIFFPTPLYLSGLSPVELEALVRTPARRVGIEADDEDVTFVRHHAGTLPFFVQATAAIWLTHKAQGRLPATREVTQRLVSEMGPYFEQWWRNFGDVEQDVLAAVAQDKPVSRLPYDEGEIGRAVERLCRYGLIAETGGRLWPDSAVFAHWLREHTGRAGRSAPLSGATIHRESAPARNGRGPAEAETALLLALLEDAGRRIEASPAGNPVNDGALRDSLAQVCLRSAPPALAILTPGVTELLARTGSGNVFAADCAVWGGQKELLQRVDRVLGSLTASGTRAAVVLFARGREFPLVVDAVVKAMPHHPGYLGYEGRRGPGRLEYRFHLPGNPHGDVALSVLLFRLPD